MVGWTARPRRWLSLGRIGTNWASRSSSWKVISANRCAGNCGTRWSPIHPILLQASIRDWIARCETGSRKARSRMVRMVSPRLARLVVQARDVVRAGGLLGLEVDCSRAPAVAGLATEASWVDVSVYEDLFGRARYVLARRSETA